MARVLTISSQVVRGHVGNSAAVFALQRLGHEVWPMPSVVLSNHPGHWHVAGTRIAPSTLEAMLTALDGNGWLREIDAILTGYLPTAAHAGFAARAIAQVKDAGSKPPLVLVDPVLGDDPGGLYIEEEAAKAVKALLVPLADILTPNRFELAWLTGEEVTDGHTAAKAAERLGASQVLATSIPGQTGQSLLNVLWQPSGAATGEAPLLPSVPHGTGDLLAALHLAHLLHGNAPDEAMRRAVAGVAAAIDASAGADELRLVASQGLWALC
jgi:pyridoxine kinase